MTKVVYSIYGVIFPHLTHTPRQTKKPWQVNRISDYATLELTLFRGPYCSKVSLSTHGLHSISIALRLAGHERSLTQIKFNNEGDLLFSCSKDHIINVWFSHNGERLGTYDGHNGTVWTIDVDCV